MQQGTIHGTDIDPGRTSVVPCRMADPALVKGALPRLNRDDPALMRALRGIDHTSGPVNDETVVNKALLAIRHSDKESPAFSFGT